MSSFTYVKIPADTTEAIEELTASKSGGLENDELVSFAKSYFQKQASNNTDNNSADLQQLPSTCEIMALSIPLKKIIIVQLVCMPLITDTMHVKIRVQHSW